MAKYYGQNDYGSDQEAIADGLFAIADSITCSMKWLGNGDAATTMGAIEALGVAIKEGLVELSDSVDELTRVIECSKG